MTDTPAPAIDTAPAPANTMPANTAPVDAGPVDPTAIDPAAIDPAALEASAATPDAPASTLDAVIGFLDVGGPVLWLLGILSVVTLALILAKFFQFSTARLNGRKGRAPLAAIATATTEAYSATGADRALAADAGRRLARRIMQPLEGGLATLGMIAMLSPLIGLLGTVLGMIDAFQALETAGSTVDPSLLSAGIWVALLTTAAGLVVAIPATLGHGWFEGRLSRFADDAECTIGDTVAHLAPAKPDLRLAAE